MLAMSGLGEKLGLGYLLIAFLPQFAGRCLPLFGDGGELRVPIHQVYPLDQVSQAHTTMRENKNIGKIILEI